jgi:hypothetical protein
MLAHGVELDTVASKSGHRVLGGDGAGRAIGGFVRQ